LVATHTLVKPRLFKSLTQLARAAIIGELGGCGLFRSGFVEIRESVDKGREVGFMVFAIEP
jgi:hypothetical protein